jgi:hypothetical protein
VKIYPLADDFDMFEVQFNPQSSIHLSAIQGEPQATDNMQDIALSGDNSTVAHSSFISTHRRMIEKPQRYLQSQ